MVFYSGTVFSIQTYCLWIVDHFNTFAFDFDFNWRFRDFALVYLRHSNGVDLTVAYLEKSPSTYWHLDLGWVDKPCVCHLLHGAITNAGVNRNGVKRMKSIMMKNGKTFWDRCARFYTNIQEKKAQELYRTLTQHIAPYLRSDMRVLEMGCGTGQLSLPLAPLVKNWIATDYSSGMIKELKKRPLPNTLHPTVQDATHLPYESKQFDSVVIANMLHIMPEPEKALQEAHRVLKENGLLIAPTFIKDEYQNKWKLWFMERCGFHIYNNWTTEEFDDFVKQFHFSIESGDVILGDPSSEYLLIARR